ncbi:16S rRNA (cytosine(1402)-N(4))-methyltransferase RsmH [Candidatus Gracilibacteria bacterium]|nr:16S rRNA (cytosine(1402)-N(4))-methyltransferase RsmH [Candidatus Gracilibacteria bacterium]
MHSELHIPVLSTTVESIFRSKNFQSPRVVDATLGLGGHAEMFCENMKGGTFIGFDRDTENFLRATAHLEGISEGVKKFFIPKSFVDLQSELDALGIPTIDAILYDLGVSSVHYDDPLRGFSIREDGPLDMRFDRTHGKTAEDIIMNLDVRELTRIFNDYGEEKKSWFIASAIIEARKNERINTTKKLLEIIQASSFDKKSPILVFQALRIAVNEEFSHIEQSLKQALLMLSVGGIIMVITFHSLEDRLVKQLFAPYLEDTIDEMTGQIREKAHYRKYTKKPIEPTEDEISMNPRSRSAKLRIIERVY